jgi:flagellin-like protein
MTKLHTKNRQLASRRAVAPVIATLLLVAIAVVGGSIIFVFSQGFFSSAQISGQPQVESVEITGYDMSDVAILTMHDGDSTSVTDGVANDGLQTSERVGVYVQNQSAQKVTLTEVRLAGQEYVYNATASLANNAIPGDEQAYYIVTRGNGANAAVALDTPNPELEAGLDATIVGRDVQFKITTANGNIFVGTVIAGQLSG